MRLATLKAKTLKGKTMVCVATEQDIDVKLSEMWAMSWTLVSCEWNDGNPQPQPDEWFFGRF